MEREIRRPGVDDADAIGRVHVRPCRDDPELGELYAMNVAPEIWGHGVGRALLEAATRELADQGFADLVLWVVPENRRARALYEAAGWHEDGETREDEVLGVTVRDMRYRRDVMPTSS